jgi:large subunit ribosomal protein L9
MEVILLERIEKLGQMGDVVKVKDGFARNFLLPRKKALRANEKNLAQFETRRVDLEATNLTARTEAEAVGEKMDGLYCTLTRQASEGGQLFGSVTARDIAESSTEGGFAINRGQVVLDRVIKNLGVHAIRVQLHPEISVTVNVNVARSEEEAEVQRAAAERGDTDAVDAAAVLAAAADAEDVHVEEFFEEEALADAEAEIVDAGAEEEVAEEAAPDAEATDVAQDDAGDNTDASDDQAESEETS